MNSSRALLRPIAIGVGAFIATALLAGAALYFLFASTVEIHPVWRDQKLPSGRIAKVTSFNLVWGDEHGPPPPRDHDCFALEFVSRAPDAEPAAREQEAREVFELVRPTSEQWGFPEATLAGFRTTERKGRYDLFIFRRGADGRWSCEREDRKVFIND